MNIATIMTTAPVIPVLVIERLEQAKPLAQALVAGGLSVLEVTLRTKVGLAAIEAMNQVEGAIVGAGTVVQPDQFLQARDAGASFAVTPGLTPRLAEAALRSELPILPGITTPAELIAAQEWGFQHLKFFPAQQAGGVPMLQALSGPFPEVKFCPTGGINAINAKDFLSLSNVLCVGGSWVTPKDKLATSDWAGIKQLASSAATLA